MVLLVSVLCVSNVPSFEVYAASSYARQVAGLVNKEREANGLSYVKYSDKLSQAATKRAEEIVSTFSHTRPDGSSCFTVIDEYGIGYYTVGENIAAGQTSPASVMNSWMNSTGHRANILNSDFNFIGVGVAKEGGMYYWVQLFAGSNSLSGTVILAEDTNTTTTADPKAAEAIESKADSKTTTTTATTTTADPKNNSNAATKTTVKTTTTTDPKKASNSTTKTTAKTTVKTTTTTDPKKASASTKTSEKTIGAVNTTTATTADQQNSTAVTSTTASPAADGESSTTTQKKNVFALIMDFLKKLFGLA